MTVPILFSLFLDLAEYGKVMKWSPNGNSGTLLSVLHKISMQFTTIYQSRRFAKYGGVSNVEYLVTGYFSEWGEEF